MMKNLLQFCKDRAKQNLAIDLLMFILLMTMAGIGFLIKYVLLPGIQRNLRYGNDIDLEYMGLDRHQWGTIHLIVSIAFLVLIAIHIILHWKMVVCIFKRMIPGRFWQTAVGGGIAVISILLVSFALFIRPEQVPHEPLGRGMQQQSGHFSRSGYMKRGNQPIPGGFYENDADKPDAEKPQLTGEAMVSPVIREKNGSQKGNDKVKVSEHHDLYEEFEVSGNQTLAEVAERYNVPASVICIDLKVPEHLAGERLGRLRKSYPFTMTDVRKSIYQYKKKD